MDKIKFKRTNTAGRVPTVAQCDKGELLLNSKDGRIFTQNESGAIVPLGESLLGGSSKSAVIAEARAGLSAAHSHPYLPLTGGTLDNGASTTLNILCDNAGEAVLNLMGGDQGTGRLFVGQSAAYGGGIEYNGDGTPVTTGAGTDYVTLYRTSNGVKSWTAKNLHGDNNWIFRGQLYAMENKRVFHEGLCPNKTQVGLGSVNNWGATSAIDSTSNTTYATAGAVKRAYDLANTKITQVQGNSWYLGKTAKAVDSDKLDGLNSTDFSRSTHTHTAAQVGAVPTTGGTFSGKVAFSNGVYMSLGEGLEFLSDDNYFATNEDARIIRMHDNNSNNAQVDGGLIFDARSGVDGVILELLRIRVGEFKWKGHNIFHEGHRPTSAEVGLGSVNNWGATSSVSDASNTKYSTAGAVRTAYNRAVSGETNAKAYADNLISQLLGDNPASHLDTIKELGDALNANGSAISAINASLATKATITQLNTKVSKTGDTMTGAMVISTTAANALEIRSASRNAGGAGIKFSDLGNSASQFGEFHFHHSDAESYGGGSSFILSSNQPVTNVVLEGTGNFKVNNHAVFHEGHVPTLRELSLHRGTSDRRKTFTVGGESNKYYPVRITVGCHGQAQSVRFQVFRDFSETAPNDWHSPTHKGGGNVTITANNNGGWGGSVYNWSVENFWQTYTTLFSDGGVTTTGRYFVIWLRGGGATWHISSETLDAISYTVHLSGFDDNSVNYPVKTSAVNTNFEARYCNRNGYIYDNNDRVFSPNNMPSTTDLNVYSKTEADGRYIPKNSDVGANDIFWSGDRDYRGLYWGSRFNDAAAHNGAWAYIRQGVSQGQLEIGSDEHVDFYETDSRVLAVQISTNSRTLDAKGGLKENGVALSAKYLGLTAKAADADKCDGLHVHGGRNNEANKIVRTDGSGYIQAGWINTTSGTGTAHASNNRFAMFNSTSDMYLRYLTPAQVKSTIGLGNVNNWSATGSVSDTSDAKYATAGAVQQTYARADSAWNLANGKMTQATGDGRYLGKTAKAADSNLIDGYDSSQLMRRIDNTTDYKASANIMCCQERSTLPVGLSGAYPYGTLLTFNDSASRLRFYAPHNEGGKSALYVSSGWSSDIKSFTEVFTKDRPPSKTTVGLSNVANYGVSTSVSSTSTTTYATSSAVKSAYDLAASKMTQATGDGRYPLKTDGTVTRLNAYGSGNDYNSGGIELYGNGSANTVFPTLGFHQPGKFASTLQLRGAADFRFYAQSATTYASITAANATFDAGVNTTVNVICDNAGEAVLNLMGSDQGTGRLFVGQSTSHGGGIEYNGDATPVGSGAGADYTALYRVSGGTKYWTARNLQSSNDWHFRATVHAPTFRGALTGNASTATWADTVDVNTSTSTGFYGLVWHSGDTLYASENQGLTVRPSDGFVKIKHCYLGGERLSAQGDGCLVAHNTGVRYAGVYGVYDSNRISHIWSMGTAYKVHASGTNFGSLYGFAYKHTNNTTGGTMGGGHMAVWCQAGTPFVSLGDNIWAKNNITAYSDARVKTDLEVIPNALDKVNQINGYTYKRTDMPDNTSRHAGVIAQEIIKVLPEVVSGGPTENEPDGHYSVAYGNIVALLIEAIKELKAEVEVLKHAR